MGIETSNLGDADNKNESQKSIEKNMDDFGYEENKEHGKHMFLSLNKEGPDAVAGYKKQSVLAWQQANDKLYSFYGRFNHYSDEELKEVYIKVMEPHTEYYFIGGIYGSLQCIAGRDGFLNQEQPTKEVIGTIEILNKLKKMNLIGPDSEEAKKYKILKNKYPQNPLPPQY